MTTRNINLTFETAKILERIIKENPEFNFSGWIQTKLCEENNAKNVYTSVERIDNEISVLKAESKLLHRRITALLSKKVELKDNIEKARLEESLRCQREEKEFNYRYNFVNEFYKEETGQNLTVDQFKEFEILQNSGELNNIYDYIAYLNKDTERGE